MLQTIVEIAGAVLCFGVGMILFAFGLMITVVFINELYIRLTRKESNK
jgi:hypothetical protein